MFCALWLVSAAYAAAPAGYQLVWNDEFTGSALDNDKWTMYYPGDWTPKNQKTNAMTNDPESVTVSGDKLKITTFTKYDNNDQRWEHRTGLISTKERALFTYGYFEARIQFNTSPAAYSAFWLMSPTIDDYLPDIGRSGTEIDIVEHRATGYNNQGDLTKNVYTAVHWGGYDEHHEFEGESHGPFDNVGNGTWNTYALLWTPESYTFYVDGVPIWHRTTEISHAQQFIHLTTYVDDDSWAGLIPDGGYGDKASSNTNMQVDYVRVYQVPEPGVAGAIVLMAGAGLSRRRGRTLSR